MKQLIESFETAIHTDTLEDRIDFFQAFESFLAERAPDSQAPPVQITGYMTLSLISKMAVAATLPVSERQDVTTRLNLMRATAEICTNVPSLSGRTCVRQALKGVAKTYYRINSFSPQNLGLVAGETITPITWESFEHAQELLRHTHELSRKPTKQLISEQFNKTVSEVFPLNALDPALYISSELLSGPEHSALR